MKKPDILVSVPSDIGAQRMGTSLAVDALLVADAERAQPVLKQFSKKTLSSFPEKRGETGPYVQGKYAKLLSELNNNTAKEISAIVKKQYPLVISGDHSNAIGIMAGIREAIGADKKLGVIWVDAHADLHTPYTTPSGNLHGMSLSASMGYDNIELSRSTIDAGLKPFWEELKHCGASRLTPKIGPEDIFFIGLRDFEIQEYHLIRDYKLNHYSPYDVKAKGLTYILDQAVTYFADYDAVYVSFDVDVLDTSVSTGTGTPVYNGLLLPEAKQVVDTLKRLKNIRLWEFTEINPLLDNNNSMSKAVIELIDVLMED
ncbi:arginase [Cytophaga hutchinsonii]|uniref:Arginase n=1 Tax=Cytophaga hutchinsonii (strain ATCC 33406 / DSM 1761 / CIP 103989 / NBRC 15051 / NCIMB 9469 / D465) TaxID=269798 RepID=A0A6N4SWQ6_CYTH3|nr:arginase [Cytophaga hutchinsonii]ABG60870.1 arginase [Cytophaga hutchinsonii ATCC 33406]SFX99977.1 arginase [Cytophaga hutchinsonii ATCC 33406]